MKKSRNLALITLADFIVRAAYQMGKTPLLPILAATLGATDVFLGFIVSVSTLTGMVLKPFIGLLSDCWGRRFWLLSGTAFFTLIPFTYGFIQTPEQLFVVRIIHGLATAIYGPVTLAYVAELSQPHRAERIGWFSIARTAGYIVGPAVAGWLLLTLNPAAVFTVIGLLSSFAFLPILLLNKSTFPSPKHRSPTMQKMLYALNSFSRTPAIWLAGSLEAMMYIALYGVKAFLPVYGLSIGVSVALVGSFFAIQEGTNLLLKPWCGRLGDQLGYLRTISLGMAVLAVALPLLPYAENGFVLILPAIVMGIGQALISPSTVALVSQQINQDNIGVAMGFIGTLKNAGKVAGPILAGLLIHLWNFSITFDLVGIVLLVGAIWIYTNKKAKVFPRKR